MATIVLSAAGGALGGAIGGSVLGMPMAVVGRAVGAAAGRMIDQRWAGGQGRSEQAVMGGGSRVVETGRIDRFRLMGASEGGPIAQLYGRARLGGQVIWATRFKESVTTSTEVTGGTTQTTSSGGGGGGKGLGGGGGGSSRTTTSRSTITTKSYHYSVSLALALCEGEISRVARVWADGNELAMRDLTMRVYTGSDAQLPDPKIAAVEGADAAPSYRGIAYVVIEDLPLEAFGNRVPQFSFEVMRPEAIEDGQAERDISSAVRGVAMMPGSGEYVLATSPVYYQRGPGRNHAVNLNTPSGQTDFVTSVQAMTEEMPNCGSTSLIVSWFGDDLRCADCTVRPRVEQTIEDAPRMPWQVAGRVRENAGTVPKLDGRPSYGGTPADASVVQAIEHLRSKGQDVVFYPFILMDQIEGNTKPDPWSDAASQPALPWRGRITLDKAPGQSGSADKTAEAETEVATFFGQASADDFTIQNDHVVYSGPTDWGYRRFVLHYAKLCALAGGVDAFCIGSEMRALTQIRGAGGSFPVVAALRTLAAEVRAILGSETKIGYAADWSEYFGYMPQDGSGDRLFHLDPLWADENVDFVGIDNYMPLSDWRDGFDHLDAQQAQTIYDLDYLKSNIEGGEGFDWYYASAEAEAAQIRTPITDDHAEPWVWRYKDIRGFWENTHHERIGGVRQSQPTAWVPRSKPIWFTELGCAAIDKGTNEPNKFLDPKSSESTLPKYSTGRRDELMQMQYLRAMLEYWKEEAVNPQSELYNGSMIDMSRAHVWAWDARPFPHFPNNLALWSDGANYARGHWLNGRATARSLASIVAEICERSNVVLYDVSRLYGFVRGYSVNDVDSGRAALQPLMLAYGFDAVERDGCLHFITRDGRATQDLDAAWLALSDEQDNELELSRAPSVDVAGRMRVNFVEADGDYEARSAEAVFPDDDTPSVSSSEIEISLTRGEGRMIAERWLTEARVARDTAKFALPPSQADLGAGDVVRMALPEGDFDFRIDHVEEAGVKLCSATRVDEGVYVASHPLQDVAVMKPFTPVAPVFSLFLDLPLMTGDEVDHAPHIAVSADPWPGAVEVVSSVTGSGYQRNVSIAGASIIGVTESPLGAAKPGLFDRGDALLVRITDGHLSSVEEAALRAGANLCAIGDGTSDQWELFQFAQADLVEQDIYALSMRLRGQLGSDALMPAVWPAGSYVVLMNGMPDQISLPVGNRDTARYYRIGPASRSYDDDAYIEKYESFQGIGLRPLSPAHLRGQRLDDGDLTIRWTRRTRLEGDSWSGFDVPLGEASEIYILRIIDSGILRREVQVSTSGWVYPAGLQAADGVSGTFEVEVAQVSERFGPGLYTRIKIND